jgi:hypothetical protein
MGEGVTPVGHGGILRQRRAEAQGPSQHHILGEKEGRYQRDRREMVPAGTPDIRKPDVVKSDIVEPDVSKPDVEWVYPPANL